MARFLFRAQDRNMTNGDFAFFTHRPMKTYRTTEPWTWYGKRFDISDELPRRRQAFYVVKQVCRLVMPPAPTGWRHYALVTVVCLSVCLSCA